MPVSPDQDGIGFNGRKQLDQCLPAEVHYEYWLHNNLGPVFTGRVAIRVLNAK